MKAYETVEILKSVTDGFIALIALYSFFSVLSIKEGGDREKKLKWCILYALISVGSVLGCVVHCISPKGSLYLLLWVPLDIIMFESVGRFSSLLPDCIGAPTKPALLRLCELSAGILLFAAVIALRCLEMHQAIYPLAVYALANAVYLASELLKAGPLSRDIKTLFLFVLLSMLSLVGKLLSEYAIVLCHIFICAIFFSLLKISKKHILE